MTRVETYLNENLRKRLDQVEQVRCPFTLLSRVTALPAGSRVTAHWFGFLARKVNYTNLHNHVKGFCFAAVDDPKYNALKLCCKWSIVLFFWCGLICVDTGAEWAARDWGRHSAHSHNIGAGRHQQTRQGYSGALRRYAPHRRHNTGAGTCDRKVETLHRASLQPNTMSDSSSKSRHTHYTNKTHVMSRLNVVLWVWSLISISQQNKAQCWM